MVRPIRIAAFVSHYIGEAALSALFALTPWIEVVLVATDDPRCKFCNPRKRLWSAGGDEDLRTLVSRQAAARSLPAYSGRVKSEQFEKSMRAVRADAIVCCCFGQRLPQQLLDLVEGRAINLHITAPGYPLEATRGADCLALALQLGTHIEYTAHRMSAEFDRGETLARSQSLEAPIHVQNGSANPEELLAFWRQSAGLVDELIRTQLLGILACDFGDQHHRGEVA